MLTRCKPRAMHIKQKLGLTFLYRETEPGECQFLLTLHITFKELVPLFYISQKYFLFYVGFQNVYSETLLISRTDF